MISLGPLLVPAILGIWPPWRVPRRAWPAVAGTVLGLLVFYLVRLSVEGSYIGFRAGQLLQLALPGLAALFFARLWNPQWTWRAAAAAIAIVLIVIGLPTTLIDTYNAQDIGNRRMGPGFRWTIPISPDQQAALDWVRRATPPDAIVQLEPVGRGRDTWSLIASFGQRRMAAGVPLPLMATPEYAQRMREVQAIYATPDAGLAWREARRLGIDYLYLDGVERAKYPGQPLDKFTASPEYFVPAFSSGEVALYAVAR